MTLSLTGIPTPLPAFRVRGKVLAVRAPSNLTVWVEEQAALQRTSVNQFLIRMIAEQRAGGPVVPADVMEWLLAQAAANRRPGDWSHALTVTVRDLAETYPLGCRL